MSDKFEDRKIGSRGFGILDVGCDSLNKFSRVTRLFARNVCER